MPLLATDLLDWPLEGPVCDEVGAWRSWWRASGLGREAPALIALRGGHAADRLGWAFAAGYQAALRALVARPGWPAWAPEDLVALCLTEATGNRPRDLQASARRLHDGGWRLDGRKRWTTLGPACDQLLVVARDGDAVAEAEAQGASPARPARDAALAPAGAPAAAPGGPAAAAAAPVLIALRVPAAAPGLVFEPMPPTAFVPEVPHAGLGLNGVVLPAAARLPGDGWNDVGKPFRTHEDTLVAVAVLAHLLREARRLDWPTDWRQRALATLQVLLVVADRPVADPCTHVLLAGALDGAQALYADCPALWARTPDDAAAARGPRDLGLMQVARGARLQRAERAWQRLG